MKRLRLVGLLLLYIHNPALGQSYRVETIAGRVADGDDMPALEAALLAPVGLAIDSKGTLYFSDSPDRIRKVTPDGFLRTVATWSAADLAVDTAGNIYSALGPYVYVIRPDGTRSTFAGSLSGRFEDGLPAIQTRLGTVGGIAVDLQGRVWISDSTNRLVYLPSSARWNDSYLGPERSPGPRPHRRWQTGRRLLHRWQSHQIK